jgi:hypothetical protein
MRFQMPIPRAWLTPVFSAALLYGCASSGAKNAESGGVPAGPLSGIVGRQLLVLPAQLISTAGAGGTYEIRPNESQLLQLLDQEITDAFQKRGVRGNWVFPRELIASATRNAGLAGNPLALPVAGIRRIKAGDTPLPEPLAGDIRGLVSLTNARYAIMPLETKIDMSNVQRRAAMRVILIDARTARVVWAGDIESQASNDPTVIRETLSPFGFRILARELATAFADMVVAQ